MDIIQAIVLGIVQGLTEFLPISSSAHLILVPYFFKWEDPGLAFDVALHMGTLVAILVFFWRDWLDIFKQVLRGDLKLFLLLVVATIPGALFGLAFSHYAEEMFRAPLLIAATQAIFGGLLYYFDKRGRKDREFRSFAIGDALAVGAAQALAIIPGVSRSGATITTGLGLGLTRQAAARFSFLMSAPIIAGAGVLKAKYIVAALQGGGNLAMGVSVGLIASTISGLFALGLLTYMLRTKTYKSFAIYRLLLSLVIVALTLYAKTHS